MSPTPRVEPGPAGRTVPPDAESPWAAWLARGPAESARRDFLRLVAPVLPAARRPRILEIACGTGRFTELLLDVAEHVHAVDAAEDAVAQCRARFAGRALTVTRTDGRSLPVGEFDLVVSYDALVRAELDVLIAYLEQAQDRLVPGGHLALHHANRPDPGSGHAPVTHGMVFDAVARLPSLEIVSQTLLRVQGRAYLDCFTVARRGADPGPRGPGDG